MSFFDDIRAKIEEVMGGAGEQIGTTVEDAKGQIEDVSGQAEDLKNNILPGQDENK